MEPLFKKGDTITDIKTCRTFMMVVDVPDYYVVRKFFPTTGHVKAHWDHANRHYSREYIEQYFCLY